MALQKPAPHAFHIPAELRETATKKTKVETIPSDSDDVAGIFKKDVDDWDNNDSEEQKDKTTESEFLLIAGPPKRGKTHFLQFYITKCFERGLFDWIVVFSPTAHNNAFDFIKVKHGKAETDSENEGEEDEDEPFSKVVYTDPTKYTQILGKILERQKKLANELGHPPGPGEGAGLIVADDVVGCIDWKHHTWQQAVTSFRHWGLGFACCVQHLPAILPVFWGSSSIIVCFKFDTLKDATAVWERVMSGLNSGLNSAKDLMNFMKKEMPVRARKYLLLNRNIYAKHAVTLTKAPPKSDFESDIVIDLTGQADDDYSEEE